MRLPRRGRSVDISRFPWFGCWLPSWSAVQSIIPGPSLAESGNRHDTPNRYMEHAGVAVRVNSSRLVVRFREGVALAGGAARAAGRARWNSLGHAADGH